MTEQVLQDVRNERFYQDGKWGTEFDDENTVNDWATYISQYMSRATKMGASKEEQYHGVIKVAALAVAAAEAFRRNNGFAPRHYDKVKERPSNGQTSVQATDIQL